MAYDRCWIFGNDFISRSFEQYFKSRKNVEYNSYLKAHFDVSAYYNNAFTSDNPSVISRVSNLMAKAMTCRFDRKLMPLPKIIILVLDDDIIKCFDDGSNLTREYGRVISYIMTEFNRSVASYKENLPTKCTRYNYPHFLWIQPPLHQDFKNNSERQKYNTCLNDLVKFHKNMSLLELKKIWSQNDPNLFLGDCQRFTSEGLFSYWEAVDWTARYCDSVVLKKNDLRKSQKMKVQSSKSDQKDRFRWKNPVFNRDFDDTPNFRKLPTPPPYSH